MAPKKDLIEAAAKLLKGGGKKGSRGISGPSMTSKQYGQKQRELQNVINTSKSASLVAAAKKTLAALDRKFAREKLSSDAKRSGSKKVTLGSMRKGKADKDFNKGGMPKKDHGKSGSYGKAYMKGGMATDMRKTGMFKGGYSTKKK
tara:strand:- start:106 stop:543 length:438 start_codon:yes stop_codon:yes gene_type:complete